jgi:nucleotide-binding universal stress UspA family protein
MGTIVVGVDESPGAAEALRWAASEGARRDWTVSAVMCWGYLDQHHPTTRHQFDPAYTAAHANAVLREIVVRVLGEAAPAVARRTVNDLAARGLLEASAAADLLVVGARGLGRFRELVLGSVSQQCLHHSKIPIAIVREDTSPRFGVQRIVVGVDGSETSQRALRWALDECRVRKACVEVVHAWDIPPLGFPALELPRTYPDLEDAGRSLVDDALEHADTTGIPTIRRAVLRGPASVVLVELAGGADLVVVGSRGLGGFKGLLLGSVSHRITHHAPCPVVVIPPVEPAEPGRGAATSAA